MTIAMAVAFALVVIITIVRMIVGGPSDATATEKPLTTPWLTFVPPKDPKAASPGPIAPDSQEFRPAPGKSAFSPSITDEELKPPRVSDAPAKANLNAPVQRSRRVVR